MHELLTTSEVAEKLGVDRSWVTRLVSSGRLVPAMRLPGRTGALLFDPADIDAMLATEDDAA